MDDSMLNSEISIPLMMLHRSGVTAFRGQKRSGLQKERPTDFRDGSSSWGGVAEGDGSKTLGTMDVFGWRLVTIHLGP